MSAPKNQPVRSRVEIVVDAGAPGASRFTKLSAEGGIAVRRTSATGVHLVGTAAGPIGDDTIEVIIVVGRGAHLDLRGVAATICLPGATSGVSRLRFHITLQSDATLYCTLPSLIVCRGSRVDSTTEVAVEESSVLMLSEDVSFGRAGEAAGDWKSRTLVDFPGRPALRQTQTAASVLNAVSRLCGRPAASGFFVSRLELGVERPASAITTYGAAISQSLAVRGRLLSAVGVDLPQAYSDIARLS